VTTRPYVLLSCAISVDGCLDSAGPARLVLSGAADLDRVDGERARADAIMVGAGTIRRDDPRLRIRSPERRAARVARGRPGEPARVTVTASGDLDPGAAFFVGPPEVLRLVYCPAPLAVKIHHILNDHALITALPPPLSLGAVLDDLAARGIGRLMVEGGARLGRQLLADGLVDELQLAVAPFFVGDAEAPRFAGAASYPFGPSQPMTLAEVRQLDGVVLLRYLLSRARDGDVGAIEGERGAGVGAGTVGGRAPGGGAAAAGARGAAAPGGGDG
jgi:riboflavin-specific deaminase-like protein